MAVNNASNTPSDTDTPVLLILQYSNIPVGVVLCYHLIFTAIDLLLRYYYYNYYYYY